MKERIRKMIRKVLRWAFREELQKIDGMARVMQRGIKMHVEGSERAPWKVIMIGKIGKREYVNIFEMHHERNFVELVDNLNEYNKYCRLGMVDEMYPGMLKSAASIPYMAPWFSGD
jgi:hypothetical protein